MPLITTSYVAKTAGGSVITQSRPPRGKHEQWLLLEGSAVVLRVLKVRQWRPGQKNRTIINKFIYKYRSCDKLYLYIQINNRINYPEKLTRPVALQVSPALGLKRFGVMPHKVQSSHINFVHPRSHKLCGYPYKSNLNII